MIITKKLNITIRSDMRKIYANLGYNIPTYKNPIIEVNVMDLQRNSQQKIEVECDVCGKIKIIPYWIHRNSMEKYGYYSCHGKCSKNKNKQTCLEKYGDENYNNRNLYKETCLEKYGNENPMKKEDIKNQGLQTKKLKYGNENYNNRIKYKETNFKKYGDENYNNPNKNKETCLEKYGVEHHYQIEEIHEKQQISGFETNYYKNLFYRGTYELDFLEKYHSKLNITKPPSIKYLIDNKNKVYHPDFYIPELNLIVEIKSDYTYNFDLNKNLVKQDACIQQNYNFIFIINRDYTEFDKLIGK